MDATSDREKNLNSGNAGASGPATPVHIKRDVLAESAIQSNEVVTSASLVPLMGALHEHLEAERRRNARRMGLLGFAFVLILIVAAAYPIYLGRTLLKRMEAAIGEDQRATRQFTRSVESGLGALTEASAQLRQALDHQASASGWSNITVELRQAMEQQAAALRMLAAATSTPVVVHVQTPVVTVTNAPTEALDAAAVPPVPVVVQPEPEGRPHFFLYRWWSEWEDPKGKKKAPKDDLGL
jgi:predicted metal-dependent hydrolase